MKRHRGTTVVKQQNHLQNKSKAVDETNWAERTWQQQDSTPALTTIVLFRPCHMTRLAFVVSLLIHRSLDCIGATSTTVVARELLPSSPLVLARFRQVSDHHTGVSFAELMKCAGAISPTLPSSPFLRSGSFKMRFWKRTGTLVCRSMDWRECPTWVIVLTRTRVGVSHSLCLVGSCSSADGGSSSWSEIWGHLKIPMGGIV
jgi:hypothetical protein